VREYHVLSLGAGVQSTAVYLLIHDKVLDIPLDVAIFADTQEEPSHVYRHLDWLRGLGGVPIWIKQKTKLGDDIMRGMNSTGQRYVSIPAYTKPDGLLGKPTGMVRRQCTKEYKTEVIERAIRRELLGLKPKQRWPAETMVHQYIGISADEAGRAARISAIFQEHHPHTSVHFPLLDLAWTRADCLRFLGNRIPHPVGRSACVFCPYKSDAEWLWLKQHDADGWHRAVEVDENLRRPGVVLRRRFKESLYLHRSGRPLKEAELNERQGILGFIQECEGMCGV